MKNKIDDLRNHLFETLEALKDKDEPMELARARAIADVGRVIKATGEFQGSTFLPAPQQADQPSAPKQLAAVGGRRAR